MRALFYSLLCVFVLGGPAFAQSLNVSPEFRQWLHDERKAIAPKIVDAESEKCIEIHKKTLSPNSGFELVTKKMALSSSDSNFDQVKITPAANNAGPGLPHLFIQKHKELSAQEAQSQHAALSNEARASNEAAIKASPLAFSLAGMARAKNSSGTVKRYEFSCTYVFDPKTHAYQYFTTSGTPDKQNLN